MKAQALLLSYESAAYLDQRMAPYKDKLTESERQRALVEVWLLKVIEPGQDEAYSIRIPAAQAPKDTELDQLLFQPVEVEVAGLAAKGFIRNGQSSGMVEADSITFQGVSVKPLGADQLRAFNDARKRLAVEKAAQRDEQRKRMEALKLEIEARLAQADAAPVKAGK